MAGDDGFRCKAVEGVGERGAQLKKWLVEQMLDAGAMKELLAKNGEACREARICRNGEPAGSSGWIAR